ncbi:hypothetical protein DM860_001042 [Cuscuta australis]|uniref:GTD-binding domain-containing protein n=1 Tax=Cuscuta australis TaxID=267555 RepID=A0A328DST4_9ASTE|nr:hypothetical protein DM860_001042 [Cuscuta australis]
MDSENASPRSASPVKCCDCGCSSCSKMEGSFYSTWARNMKRKYDEHDVILPHTARIDIENECAALREMVSKQQQTILDLSIELEKERNASSSAANEAMSMILRLQREKAEIQMEYTQFKRFTDEKMVHDQHEMDALEELLYKREQTIQSLTCAVQMYKHRMLSFGLTESEVGGGECDNKGRDLGTLDGEFELASYDYPPLKCLDENQVCSEVENEIVDVEKHAFGETPRSNDHLRDLECRINQLERSPTISHPDVLEKVIVDQKSPHRPRLVRKFSTGSEWTEFPQPYEHSNLRKVDSNESQVDEDVMSDRVYTIDSIHQSVSHNDVKASAGIGGDDFITSPRYSLSYTNLEDPDIKKLYMRLQALEADRESMRQSIISLRTDKAQLVLLKEIAQQLCKDMSPARGAYVRRPSPPGMLSFTSISMWIRSLLVWRRKASRCKYGYGLSNNNAGLLMLLNKGPCVGQWRCLSSTQL